MRSLKLAGVLGLVAITAGCVPDWARQNETGLLMEISEIVTLQGDEDLEGSVLLSDVDPDFNDDARLTVALFRKDPTVGVVSPLESVRLESYQVRYFRTDGHSVEGFDVPHRITGPLATTLVLPPSLNEVEEAEVIVTLVRHQAKHEAPLINLVGIRGGNTGLLVPGQGIITTVAEITIYGRQVTSGEPLSATGRVQVTFADFADEE